MKLKNKKLHPAFLTVLLPLLAFNAWAFTQGKFWSEKNHQAITADGMKAFTGHLVGWDVVVGEMKDGNQYLNSVQTYNAATDDDQTPYLHFDDENFFASSKRLVDLKSECAKALAQAESGGDTWWAAQKKVGEALHTLQDFYAHSSWVELGHYDGEIYDRNGARLGVDVIQDPPSWYDNHYVTCASTEYEVCLTPFGPCWTKSYYNVYKLGSAGVNTLTTGWYERSPGGKVRHGLNGWGLNKDGSVHAWHADAMKCAVKATTDFLQQIFDEPCLRDASPETIKRALSILGFGSGVQVHPLGIVMDNSFYNTKFSAAQSSAHSLVMTYPASSYLLQTYDIIPLPDPVEKTAAEKELFLAAVDGVVQSPTDKGCPTHFYHALGTAVEATGRRANIVCFSGGTIRDIGLYGTRRAAVTLQLQDKGDCLTVLRFYDCPSTSDGDHFKIADAVGGMVFQVGNETPNLTPLVDGEISGNDVTLLSASGSLATNTVKEFTFPIDATVSNVTLLVTLETNTAISFRSPSGSNITAGAGISMSVLQKGQVATIAQPMPGNWVVHLEGSGHFAVNVRAATPIELSQFGFQDEVGRPIPGQPTQATNSATAFLTGDYTNVSFSFLTPDGDLIHTFAMAGGGYPTNVPGEWEGVVTLPSQPFKVQVNGTTAQGLAFQRVFPQRFEVQAVEVRSLRPVAAEDDPERVSTIGAEVLTPGLSHHVRYQVRNLMASAGTFAIDMAAAHATVSNLGPTNVDLDAGATSIVEADILLPPGTDVILPEEITVAVVNTNDPTIYNGMVDRFEVGPAYVGDTTIDSSTASVTVALSQPEMITNGPAGGDLVLIGGAGTATLDLNGKFETINGLVSQGIHSNTRVTSGLETTLIVGDNDADAIFGGQIRNAVHLVKIGNGTQTLTGANSYTNDTKVVSGVLALGAAGSISNTPLISVQDGGTFDVSQATGGWSLNAGQTLTGGGVVTGSVVAASGSWIAAPIDGSTLSFANDLTFNGDTTNIFLLLAPFTNTPIAVAGNLTLNGSFTALIAYDALPQGRYRLFTYGGSLTGPTAANLVCFPDGARQTAYLDTSVGGEIDVVVVGYAGTLTWAGDGVLNNWDATATNWLNGGSPDLFFPDDSVIFDDTGSRSPAVNLASNLAPSSILVNSSYDYTFAGSGKISGNASLVKDGSGELIIANTNDYGGNTTINAGTMRVNGSLAGLGAVTVAAGATLGGHGTIMGPVIVEIGATIAPDHPCCPTGQDGEGLTVNNTLSLAGTTALGINKTAQTNDQVRGITTVIYGGTLALTNRAGTLAPGDSFKLFSATNYAGTFASISPASPGAGLVWNTTTLATDGTLRISASVATNPTNLMATVIGGNTLQLAWPADHKGWTLEFQTNSFSLGLGTNWLPVTGSTLTNQMTIPIDPASGSRFYRMKFTP